MPYTTIKGKIILSPPQENLIEEWCTVLHAEWNACVAAFQKSSICKQQKQWRKRALEDLLSDREGKAKKQLKILIEKQLDNGHTYPLHEWSWAPLKKAGDDGKVETEFHLSCRLQKARNVKNIHEPRQKESEQNPLIEFYRYESELLTPYICPLPPVPERDEQPKYDKIASHTRSEHPLGKNLNTRYENGLIKRFRASVQLFFKTLPNGKPPKFKKRSDPLRWLFTYQSDALTWNKQGISLPGKKTLGILVDQNANLRKRLAGYAKPDIRSAALSKEHDGWYLSLTIGYQSSELLSKDSPELRAVGIDMGVVHHATTSDGQMFGTREKLPKRLAFLNHKVERLQKKAAKQKLRSKGWKKTQQQIRAARAEIARNRKAWAEQFTTRLIERYDFIAVENLTLGGMKAKAKARLDEDGKWTQNKAKAKTGLNRSLATAAPGATIAMLERKAEKYPGKTVVKVDPKHTSQTCSQCGHRDKASRQTQDSFVCTSCGYADNADINAAKNILNQGLQSLSGISK